MLVVMMVTATAKLVTMRVVMATAMTMIDMSVMTMSSVVVLVAVASGDDTELPGYQDAANGNEDTPGVARCRQALPRAAKSFQEPSGVAERRWERGALADSQGDWDAEQELRTGRLVQWLLHGPPRQRAARSANAGIPAAGAAIFKLSQK